MIPEPKPFEEWVIQPHVILFFVVLAVGIAGMAWWYVRERRRP